MGKALFLVSAAFRGGKGQTIGSYVFVSPIGQRHEQYIPAGGTLFRTFLRFHEDDEEKSFWRSNSSSTMK